MSAPGRPGAHPSLVLSPWLEPLVRGRRVAVLGDATIGLAELLAERGARLAHAYDPDRARAAEAIARSGGARGAAGARVAHGVLEADLGVRDGAFDVIVVPDLAAVGTAADVVRTARRLAGSSGVVVVASPNPEIAERLLPREGEGQPAGYYDLYDAMALQFPVVRMAGQAPFVGYAVVDFAPDEEPDVTVDASLLEETEVPEWFVAVGSHRPVDLDAYSVVQLPFSDVGAPARGAPAARSDAELALAETQARLALVSAELDKMRELRHDESRAAERRATTSVAAAARLAELESEIREREARVREAEARAGDAHVRAERLKNELADTQEEVAQQRDRATRLARQLEDEKKARQRADVELGMARAKPEPAPDPRHAALAAELEESTAKIEGLERALEDARAHAAAAATERDDALARVREMELALEDADRVKIDLLERCKNAEDRAVEIASSIEGAEAPDVEALEAALRDRGHRIAELERQLRESERIGRELLEDLEAARSTDDEVEAESASGRRRRAEVEAAPPPVTAPSAAPVGDAAALASRMDSLAARAARSEADLTAATWRIAELERRLADALDPERSGPSAANAELEQALIAAREEVATLRSRVIEAQGAGASRDVVEQSVLLHQVAAQPGRGAAG